MRNLYDNKKCDLLKNLCQIRKWRCQAMCDDDLIVDFCWHTFMLESEIHEIFLRNKSLFVFFRRHVQYLDILYSKLLSIKKLFRSKLIQEIFLNKNSFRTNLIQEIFLKKTVLSKFDPGIIFFNYFRTNFIQETFLK